MSLTVRVVLGLAAGLLAGIAVSFAHQPGLDAAVRWIEPLGTIWINALRMTIIPLVVAGLVAGAASSRENRQLGKLGWQSLVIFLALLCGGAALTLSIGPLAFRGFHLAPDAAQALRATAGAATLPPASGLPDLRAWLIALVPTNAVKAAADGALLPLIVFSIAAGLAVSRIPPEQAELVVRLARAVFTAMLMLVRWILELAPIGVFALALPLATSLGVQALGAVAWYVGVVVGLTILVLLLLYPVVAVAGRVSPVRFFRGAAPAQAVAFSGRSSLASLPAMIEGGERHLGFPAAIRDLFLPVSASTFRLGGTVGLPVGVLFLAKLYGIELSAAQLLTVGLTSVLLTFSIPGVPGGSILIMLPLLSSVGIPAQGLGILLGVDTIPDMFRTTANVTGTMAAATILSGKGQGFTAPSLPLHDPDDSFSSGSTAPGSQ